jgi:cytochrome c biogenesis protein ResB
MNAPLRFFRSVRLAIVLILVIVALSIISTLVPQGREEAFYKESYAPAVSQLILASRMDRFFSSVLFLLPVALFTINLGVCAVDRLVKRRRARAPRRYGPDLIHLGLLLLIAGGILTTALRREKLVWLGVGDTADLNGGYSISLQSFQYQKYENGSPKDWISTVSVQRDGRVQNPSFRIEVNRPLRLGRLRLYQSSFTTEGVAHLKDTAGEVFAMKIGEVFRTADALYYFADAELEQGDGTAATAVFQKWIGHSLAATLSVGAPGAVGPYQVTQVSARRLTGLTAVSDPGMFPVIIALIIVGAGLALTYYQKLREEKP